MSNTISLRLNTYLRFINMISIYSYFRSTVEETLTKKKSYCIENDLQAMKQVVKKSFKKAAELNCSETCKPGCKWKYKTCDLKIRTNLFILRVVKHWIRLPVEFHGLWRYSKSDGKWSWATLSRRPCFEQRLGLHDPESPSKLSCYVTLWTKDPLELDHKNLLFISPETLLQDLYSNLKVSLRLYLKTTWVQFRPLIVFHQNALMHQSTLIH